ncbi:Integrator complex subunit 10 [Heterocephalus glaber]|uniref:Integrator complex subunit 10 n=1 Tax=Heterocephalus glaber TaxID=10181 RepID=G5BCZ9_HETGA|nr:Integrator complex subunit 10 [Heterocephalus glaber]
MLAQNDSEFMVQRALELVPQDLWAAKAWLIMARTLYLADFNIQYEMYTIERKAERTVTVRRLLYDMFVNFPDQPVLSGRCCEQSSAPSLGHHTVIWSITKGVKEDFRLAMECQVSRCRKNLMVVLHKFCIKEKILLLQTLT